MRFLVLIIILFISKSGFAESLLDCSRIVSLAPSITETLYAINLGDSVVAVTRYDTYPPEVKTKKNIGGFLDPSIEGILSQKPTLVIGLHEQRAVVTSLEKLKITALTVEHRTLEGILESITTLGKMCEKREAVEVRISLEKEMSNAKANAKSLKEKRVVIVVSRSYDSATLKNIYLSGDDGYYSELLKYAGAQNIFQKPFGSINEVSFEGLVSLEPEAIIEVLPPGEINRSGRANLMKAWENAPVLEAVKSDSVYLIDDDWATVPGPRFPKLFNAIKLLLHPDIS